jgi:hypothetical protein
LKFINIFLIIVFISLKGFNYGQDRIQYNHPNLKVDLGVGLWAWPLPIDYDKDGDLDLVVVCPDKPYNGTYFFENPGIERKMPVFKAGRRISKGPQNVQISYINGEPLITTPGRLHLKFFETQFTTSTNLPLSVNFHEGKKRTNLWKFADYDNDGLNDLIVGIGDWNDYGWDNAFDKFGKWNRGPLHGYVYFAKNIGTLERPKYNPPKKILADGKSVDVYGMPSPNLADFDNDGDLDLLCGEFLDGFTYYQNTGTAKKPVYNSGTRLPVKMDLQMITPVVIDWDGDKDFDIICGDEDGRVAFIENTGKFNDKDIPLFIQPKYFQQEAADIKFGALVTPVGFDWDGDGDQDLVCGNTAGYIGFIENLSGPGIEKPKFDKPVHLQADGKTIRLQAGKNGSIQGPCEAKWGYSTISVADWDHDGRPDIIANGIWGKVSWFRNIGTRRHPRLAKAQLVDVAWNGAPPKPSWNWWNPPVGTLATQWRTTPVVHDWNKDGINDLIMLDHEGYLAYFRGTRSAGGNVLHPPRRIFNGKGEYDSAHRLKSRNPVGSPIRLNIGSAGKSGRRKLCLSDWDGDGLTDLLVNSINVNLLRNTGEKNGITNLRDVGTLSTLVLTGHSTSPTTVDWNADGIPDLLIGAEDGFMYYHRNPRSKGL